MMPSKLPKSAYVADVTRHDFAAAVARMKEMEVSIINVGFAMAEDAKKSSSGRAAAKPARAARRS
jgi:hypothetical protein